MYTTSDDLQAYVADHEGLVPVTHSEGYVSPFHFAEDGTPEGEAASKVTVSFSGYKETSFVYDEASGTYKVFFFGDMAYVDEAADGAQVEVTNILILPAPQSTKPASEAPKGNQRYDLSGGTGYYVSGGKYIEINWQKAYYATGDFTAPLVLTNTVGSPLEMNVGSTYICIPGNTRPITFE